MIVAQDLYTNTQPILEHRVEHYSKELNKARVEGACISKIAFLRREHYNAKKSLQSILN